MKILLVEDNNSLALNVSEYLEGKGYLIDYAADGLTGLSLATSEKFDVMILDIMLPGLNGIELCRRLRDTANDSTPIIILTAKDTERDKLAGFGAGADDYLVKPFSLPELEARLLALVRRNEMRYFGKEQLIVGDIVYDPVRMTLMRGGVELQLMRVPLKILILLMQKPNQVVTREEIEQHIWHDEPPNSEVMRSHIYAIRNVINTPGSSNILHTIRGVGYILGEQDNS